MNLQIFLLVIYLYYAYWRCRDNSFLRKTVMFFVALYGGQLVLAIADPYDFYTIRPSTILFFNLQIIFLLIGMTYGMNRIGHFKDFDVPRIFNIKVNRAVLIIQTVALILSYNRYSKMSSYITSMEGLTDSARGYFFTEMYSSYTEQFLNEMVGAFQYVSYFYAFGLLFLYAGKLKWKEWYMIISGFGIIILDSMASLGRGVVFNIIVALLMFYFFSGTYDQKSFKKRVRPVALSLVGVVGAVIVFATMIRSNVNETNYIFDNANDFILKPFVSYFYVPVCAFDYGTEKIFGDLVPLFGAADLAAPIDLLMTPFQFIDHNIHGINDLLGNRMTPRFEFPSGETWNALFTGASNYYIDFGFFGFILFPFIHGLLFVWISNKSRRSGAWFIVLLFLFMSSFKHLVSSNIQSLSTVFVFIWIWYIRKTRAVT